MSKYNTQIVSDCDAFLGGVRRECAEYTKLVSQTAGPGGHNVMLISNGRCHLTKDGISVLRSVVETDTPEQKTAIAILRDASEQTNKTAGDGTTATCILANEIFQEGYRYVVSGCNGNALRRGISKAVSLAVDFVTNSLSVPVKGVEDIKRVARISSNGSDEIADVIADVFDHIGKDGTAYVELSNTTRTTSRIANGMTFERGMVSPYFATNDRGEATLDNPVILIVDKKISVVGELIKPFEALMKMNRPILLIAEGYEQDIINTLVVNKLRGLPVCAIEAPGWGDLKTEMLEDIAVATDARVISQATGLTFQDAIVQPGILGHAKRVVVSRDVTSIVTNVDMNPETNSRLKERVDIIQAAIDDPSKNEREKTSYRTRKARLLGGIGVIMVGGSTDAEVREKKDLVDDAFSSVKSSLQRGVVPGGGVTFLCVQNHLRQWLSKNKLASEEEALGFLVFTGALSAYCKCILRNLLHDNEQTSECLNTIVNTNKTLGETTWAHGYNANTQEHSNLYEDGIIDSTESILSAMQNGASAGGSLLTMAGCSYTPEKPAIPIPEE